jgi:hypothetical protein
MLIPFGVLSAAGAEVVDAGAYELIASEILGSSQASVTFSSLATYASIYKHLHLRLVARDTVSATGSFMKLTFNGATTGMNEHYLNGNGSSVTSAYFASGSSINFGSITGNTATASSFGAALVDILDAFSSTKNTTTRSLDGVASSVNNINLRSGLWNSTASITSVTVAAANTSFVAGSRFSLYGIKG